MLSLASSLTASGLGCLASEGKHVSGCFVADTVYGDGLHGKAGDFIVVPRCDLIAQGAVDAEGRRVA